MADATLTIDSSQFVAALNQIRERQEVVNDLVQMFGKDAAKAYTLAERSAKQAARGPSAFAVALEAQTDASRSTAAGMQQLSFQLNDVFTQLASGAPVTQVFAQQGGQIVGAFQQAPGLLSSVGSGAINLAGTLGAVGLALSPLIVGWLDYTQAQKLATEASKTFSAAQDSTISLLERAEEDVRKLTQVQKGFTDEEKQADAILRSYADSRAAANEEHEAAVEILAAQLGLTDNLAAVNEKLVAQGKEEVSAVRKSSSAWKDLKVQLDNHIQAMEDVDRAAEDGSSAALLVMEYNNNLKETEGELEKAIRSRAKAQKQAKKEADPDREAADALREQMERIERVNRLEADRRANIAQTASAFEKLYESAIRSAASEEDRIALTAQASRDALQAAALEATYTAESADQRIQIQAELREGLRAINDQELADFQKLEDAKTAKAAEEADKRLKQQRQQVGYVADAIGAGSDLLDTLYEHQAAAAEEGSAAQKEAALKTFQYRKALAVSESVVNTALAASAALATPPAPNVLAALAAGALGAAQVAAIASQPAPTFGDTPRGGWQPSAQNRSATFSADDTVIAARDPRALIAQAVAATANRPLPQPATRTERRRRAAPPVARLLTDDLSLTTRGHR